ncbi:MAG: CotS family spore coat protein [Oscillospiraceae bacterium]|nr:CotS family spore coat protein [Oscillospiraceae bacterium]
MMREFEIERQFRIKIESLKPNKGVYYLKTNMGSKCLKKINYGVQKLMFVYGAKEYLIANGFKNVDRYDLNVEGLPYALVNEDIYTLSEWIEGRELNYEDKDELRIASMNLANLHNASRGYEPPENSKLKTDLGRWTYLMQKRINSFEKMKDMARKRSTKTQFDFNYTKNVSFFTELGKRAMKVLAESKYEDICKKTEEEKMFCHHDYTHHNIIIDNNNNYNVIDFDYCKREVRVYDISSVIIKICKRMDWGIEYANIIIDSYNKVSPLLEEEYKVLFAFLLFPQRFWRLSNRYYYNEVNWSQSTYTSKLSDLTDEGPKYIEFLERFKKIYNQIG